MYSDIIYNQKILPSLKSHMLMKVIIAAVLENHKTHKHINNSLSIAQT